MRRAALPPFLAAALAACGAAGAQDLPQPVFLPLKGAAPGAFSYARLSDIQVFLDASPTRCAVILVNGEEIRAFQRCAEITSRLSHDGFLSLPSSFGSALLAPGFVTSLISQSDGFCRLNLRNGRWIPAKLPCDAVRETLEGR
ncbi:hypothetical protein [Methylocella sp.]|uniref:hypothetical protein n=1 Tax=Methylocella sp. TaxID=1978226 RepID=UPI003783EB24